MGGCERGAVSLCLCPSQVPGLLVGQAPKEGQSSKLRALTSPHFSPPHGNLEGFFLALRAICWVSGGDPPRKLGAPAASSSGAAHLETAAAIQDCSLYGA